MGAMYKKEVLITPTSSISMDAAINWVEGWLNKFYVGEHAPVFSDEISEELQELIGQSLSSSGNANYDPSKFGSNEYNDFFADIFDSRDGSTVTVFHSACAKSKKLDKLVYSKTAATKLLIDMSVGEALKKLQSPAKAELNETIIREVVEMSAEDKSALAKQLESDLIEKLTTDLTQKLTQQITEQVTRQVLGGLSKTSTGDSPIMSEAEISEVVEAKASELVAKQLPMLEEKIAQLFQEKSEPIQLFFEALQSDIQKDLSELKLIQADISGKKQAIDDQVAFFAIEKQKAAELSTQHAENSQQAHESIESSIAELKQLDQGIKEQLEQNTLADNQRLERINTAEKTLTEKFVSLEALVKTTDELSVSSRQSINDSAEKAQKETNAILAELRLEVEKAGAGEKLMQLEMSLQTLHETVYLLPKTAGDTSSLEKSFAELSQTVEQLRGQVNINSEKLNQPVVQPASVVEAEAEEEIIADEFADDMGGVP